MIFIVMARLFMRTTLVCPVIVTTDRVQNIVIAGLAMREMMTVTHELALMSTSIDIEHIMIS